MLPIKFLIKRTKNPNFYNFAYSFISTKNVECMADHISELHDNQAYLHGVINPTTQMFTMKVRFGILQI